MENILNGIAVIIDDEVFDPEATNTNGIINQIEKENIPILKYTNLPNINFKHFQNLSFVMLDWRLIKQDFSGDDIYI